MKPEIYLPTGQVDFTIFTSHCFGVHTHLQVLIIHSIALANSTGLVPNGFCKRWRAKTIEQIFGKPENTETL